MRASPNSNNNSSGGRDGFRGSRSQSAELISSASARASARSRSQRQRNRFRGSQPAELSSSTSARASARSQMQRNQTDGSEDRPSSGDDDALMSPLAHGPSYATENEEMRLEVDDDDEASLASAIKMPPSHQDVAESITKKNSKKTVQLDDNDGDPMTHTQIASQYEEIPMKKNSKKRVQLDDNVGAPMMHTQIASQHEEMPFSKKLGTPRADAALPANRGQLTIPMSGNSAAAALGIGGGGADLPANCGQPRRSSISSVLSGWRSATRYNQRENQTNYPDPLHDEENSPPVLEATLVVESPPVPNVEATLIEPNNNSSRGDVYMATQVRRGYKKYMFVVLASAMIGAAAATFGILFGGNNSNNNNGAELDEQPADRSAPPTALPTSPQDTQLSEPISSTAPPTSPPTWTIQSPPTTVESYNATKPPPKHSETSELLGPTPTFSHKLAFVGVSSPVDMMLFQQDLQNYLIGFYSPDNLATMDEDDAFRSLSDVSIDIDVAVTWLENRRLVVRESEDVTIPVRPYTTRGYQRRLQSFPMLGGESKEQSKFIVIYNQVTSYRTSNPSITLGAIVLRPFDPEYSATLVDHFQRSDPDTFSTLTNIETIPPTATKTAPPTADLTTARPIRAPVTRQPTSPPTSKQPTRGPITKKPTSNPTSTRPTRAPVTKQPTSPPTSKEPTRAPITKQPTSGPTSMRPTGAPVTKQPTSPPTTKEPTGAPITKQPTSPPTSKRPTNAPTPPPSVETPEPTLLEQDTNYPSKRPSPAPTDFLFVPFPVTVMIQGLAWLDTNENGLFETFEPPMEGLFVNLRECLNDKWRATTSTSAIGQFQFVGVQEGEYYVDFFKPNPQDQYGFTIPRVGGTNIRILDSDVVILDENNGKSECMEVKDGFKQLTNAGYVLVDTAPPTPGPTAVPTPRPSTAAPPTPGPIQPRFCAEITELGDGTQAFDFKECSLPCVFKHTDCPDGMYCAMTNDC